jgi:hypothetical protein
VNRREGKVRDIEKEKERMEEREFEGREEE